MKKFLQAAASCVLFVVFVGVFVVGVVVNQAQQFWLKSAAEDASIIEFVVEDGQGLSGIADELEAQGLVRSAFWFKVYARFDNSARNLQAGSFNLQYGMSYADVVDVLIDAESEEVTITIPEGYTLEQMGEVVTKNLDITITDWALMTGLESPLEDHPFVVAAQKPENVDLEGYLFPDTYRFFATATAEDVATAMLEEMQANVESVGISYGRVDDVTTLHEALTLASIVEREVRAPDEMKTVAGIFYNRLEIGMALQADSTVNYFTGKDTPSVSLADTEIDSPYNTYLYAGLPPGAISNPGLNALQAVALPTDTPYFYFLTSPEGTVHYATTFDEHILNRNLYLR